MPSLAELFQNTMTPMLRKGDTFFPSLSMKALLLLPLAFCIMVNNANAEFSEKDLREFLLSESGIKKLKLTSNKEPINAIDLNNIVEKVLDQMKDQVAYKLVAEQHKNIMTQATLDLDKPCDPAHAHYKDKHGHITMGSVLRWHQTLAENPSAQLCNLDQGLICSLGKCQCKRDEVYEDKQCRKLPQHPCTFVDWKLSQDRDMGRKFLQHDVDLIPATLVRPEPPSPCVSGAVCRPMSTDFKVGPICSCFDNSKQHCSGVSQGLRVLSEANGNAQPSIKAIYGDKCTATHAEEVLKFKKDAEDGYEGKIPTRDRSDPKYCEYWEMINCLSGPKDNERVCKRSTDLCSHIHGTFAAPDVCYDYMKSCNRPSCRLGSGFGQMPGISNTHPYNSCVKGAYAFKGNFKLPEDIAQHTIPYPDTICLCEDETKFGGGCQRTKSFFGKLLSFSNLKTRNRHGYRKFNAEREEEKRGIILNPLSDFENKLHYNLEILESKMVLPENSACDHDLHEKVQAITLDFYGNMLPVTKDEYQEYLDQQKYKERIIEDDKVAIEQLKNIVTLVGKTSLLCNMTRFEICKGGKCVSKRPKGIIPLPEGGLGYSAESDVDCNQEPNATDWRLVFGSVKNKCVQNAFCIPCSIEDVGHKGPVPYRCVCEDTYKAVGGLCVKRDPSEPHGKCNDVRVQDIHRLLNELKIKQISMKMGEVGCDIELEKKFQEILHIPETHKVEFVAKLEELLLWQMLTKNSSLFCNPTHFLQCQPQDGPTFDTKCGCFDGMEIGVDKKTCGISQGFNCSSSWKIPELIKEHYNITSVPECAWQRCVGRPNGTYTCDPDPFRSIFRKVVSGSSSPSLNFTLAFLLSFVSTLCRIF